MPPLPKSLRNVDGFREVGKEKTYYRCPRCSVPSVPIIVDTPVCPLCGEETEVYIPAEGEKAGEVLVKTRDQLLTPYWQDGKSRVRIFQGDVRAKLKCIPSNSIQCVVTSPPYWGLRDYGTATWVGGDPKCDHKLGRGNTDHKGNIGSKNETGNAFRNSSRYVEQGSNPTGRTCRCGAKRIDAQIGSEERPDCLGWATGNKCGECHVCVIVEVFREVKRVLRNDGVLWLNYGDSYSNSSGYKEGRTKDTVSDAVRGKDGAFARRVQRQSADGQFHIKTKTNIPEGNLVGIPWRVAFALQADGWILRQDIIWSRPNPMRESVRNRCTKSHEYVFMLVKSTDYYFDQEAIRVPLKVSDEEYKRMLESKRRQNSSQSGTSKEAGAGRKTGGFNSYISDKKTETYIPSGANKLSVWEVPSTPYPGAHYATFGSRLITPCILAGTSAHGACVQCGAPWERITERVGGKASDAHRKHKLSHTQYGGKDTSTMSGKVASRSTLGWQPTCQCDTHEIKPCVVLDPFFGSGTTGDVCIQLGRHCVGIELSEEYVKKDAIPRVEKAIIKCAWTKKTTK